MKLPLESISDELNVLSNTGIMEQLESDEKVVLSLKVYKYCIMKSERSLLITTCSILNLNVKKLTRRIRLKHVCALSVNLSNKGELVIHE